MKNGAIISSSKNIVPFRVKEDQRTLADRFEEDIRLSQFHAVIMHTSMTAFTMKFDVSHAKCENHSLLKLPVNEDPSTSFILPFVPLNAKLSTDLKELDLNIAPLYLTIFEPIQLEKHTDHETNKQYVECNRNCCTPQQLQEIQCSEKS